MKLDDIRTMVLDSTIDAWSRLDPPHGLAALDGGSSQIEISSFFDLMVFRDDVRLSIIWGVPERPEERRTPWSERFVHDTFTVYIAEVRWNGAKVDQVTVFSVDGHAVSLPAGRTIHDGETKGSVGNAVTEYATRVAQILSNNEGPEFWDYMKRAGFVVEDRMPT